MGRSRAASGAVTASGPSRRVSAGQLAPVARETVHDRVYRELRKALIYGAFEPGQVLTIQDLATSLSTSTMPVRDALARLVSEQALEDLPSRSIRVPLADATRLRDLLQARLIIEGAALDLAIPRLGRQDIDALRSFIRDYDRALSRRGRGRIEAELEANRAFHFHLYRAAGSAVLIPIIESLWLQSGPIVRAAVSAFDLTSELSAPHYHAEIIAAVERGEAAAARAALVEDISRAFGLVEAELEKLQGANANGAIA